MHFLDAQSVLGIEEKGVATEVNEARKLFPKPEQIYPNIVYRSIF